MEMDGEIVSGWQFERETEMKSIKTGLIGLMVTMLCCVSMAEDPSGIAFGNITNNTMMYTMSDVTNYVAQHSGGGGGGGGLTTNDVASIVQNLGEYLPQYARVDFGDKIFYSEAIQSDSFSATAGWQDYTDGNGNDLQGALNAKANLSDLDRMLTTNDVCNIVTNEVFLDWKAVAAFEFDIEDRHPASLINTWIITNIDDIVNNSTFSSLFPQMHNGEEYRQDWEDRLPVLCCSYRDLNPSSQFSTNACTLETGWEDTGNEVWLFCEDEVRDIGVILIRPTHNALGLARLIDIPCEVTTNDVCQIVTNQILSSWLQSNGNWGILNIRNLDFPDWDAEYEAWVADYEYWDAEVAEWQPDQMLWESSEGYSLNSTNLPWDTTHHDLYFYRVPVNALGLARLIDVPTNNIQLLNGAAYTATNDVCNIVTNTVPIPPWHFPKTIEVGGEGFYYTVAENKEWVQTYGDRRETYYTCTNLEYNYQSSKWMCRVFIYQWDDDYDTWLEDYFDYERNGSPNDRNITLITQIEDTTYTFEVSRDDENALGLARLSDIESVEEQIYLDITPLQLAAWYPDGNVTNTSQITQNIKYTYDNATHTATVRTFCNLNGEDLDNSNLSGTVVIPPYVMLNGEKYEVTNIEERDLDQWDYNTNLTYVIGASTIKSIGYGAFLSCARLTGLSFPAVTSIGNYAFASCVSLESISLPKTRHIGEGAFQGCSLLETVSFPSAISIGDAAFYECINLKSILAPALIDIGAEAFDTCYKLESISFPSVFSIYSEGFQSCTNLKSVLVPSANNIGENAFEGCSSLESVDFGEQQRPSIPEWNQDMFLGVPDTCKIIVPDGNYTAWTNAWEELVSQGYRFIKHSEWEYARKYEIENIITNSPSITSAIDNLIMLKLQTLLQNVSAPSNTVNSNSETLRDILNALRGQQ